jgi:hypothetical protein
VTTVQQSGFRKDITGQYIVKDPAAVLDFSVDWSDWAKTGETISTSVFAIEGTAGNLTLTNQTILSNVTSVTISNGYEGNTYVIKNTITTNASNTDIRRFKLKVEKRYA